MSFLSKWNGWKRGKWEDKNSYVFGVSSFFFSNVNTAYYIPFNGQTSEDTDPANLGVQFVPPSSGRLLSLSIYSDAVTLGGSTIVVLRQNGGPGEIGRKTIVVPSLAKETFDFTKDLTSGTMQWDVKDGTTLGIQVDSTNALRNCTIVATFEVYR